jgi:hypothetical protein
MPFRRGGLNRAPVEACFTQVQKSLLANLLRPVYQAADRHFSGGHLVGRFGEISRSVKRAQF